ncbi:MAG: hypothetical protein PUF71_02925 [Firmicutes bacterium]|nr:hypothetical protein [Bacillota bacterium]
MAEIKYTGSGSVAASDVKYVKWVGKTKDGKAVSIELPEAICLSNPDWKFAEKDDTVPEIEFTALYDDEKLATGDRTEPWSITMADGTTAGNGEILLGVGKFYVGTRSIDAACVGLTRGGGSFVVEREYREINADDDPGPVKDRIHQEGGRPKLKFSALQWLTKIPNLYAGMKTVSAT